MTSAAFEDVEGLERALRRHGSPMTVEEFVTVLAEAGRAPDPLTRQERRFLLAHGGVSEEELSDRAQRRAMSGVASGRAVAAMEVEEESMTTAEVAGFLGRAEANIRRSRIQGDLYAVNAGVRGTSLRFPTWQFRDGKVVPGLRSVIPMFPRWVRPRVIETFMTSANENLGGKTPVAWLSEGGSPELVGELAEATGIE